MVQVFYLLFSLVIGMGASVQVSLIGAMGRERGPFEAALVSIIGTVTGLALVLSARATRNNSLALPAPMDQIAPFLLLATIAGTVLVLSARGLSPYYMGTGLFAVPFLVGAAFLVPRMGIALFLVATIAGQLAGSLVMDHIGAFGAQVREASLAKVFGIAVVLAGILLVQRAR